MKRILLALFTLGFVCLSSPTALAQAAPPLIISEFRVRGAGGSVDEFIEIYNNSDSNVTVNASDLSAGFALAASDGIVRFIIPNTTMIPARGHYLGVHSSYTLGSYPAGNGTTAMGDAIYGIGIADNAGIALFNTANPANFTLANRLDAVGNTSEANTLYREGAGLPVLPAFFSFQYSWVRRLPGGCTGTNPGFVNHNCTTPTLVGTTPPPSSGNSQDTGDNAADFLYVEVNGTAAMPLKDKGDEFPQGILSNQRLGAPGPENLTSPIVRGNPNGSGVINPSLVDPGTSSGSAPNRVRDPVNDPGEPNDDFGKIDIRRQFTNNTGSPVTRLRFRIMDISTSPPGPGIADLRALSSIRLVGVPVSGGGTVDIEGTTIEQPPLQSSGGAFNSTLSAETVTLGTSLAPGASINLRFLFGVMATGKFRVFVTTEALP